MNKKLNDIGLCARARGIILGEELVLEAVRKGKVYLIFLANDAGQVAQKCITDKAKYYNVPVDNSFSTIELSNAIGKENRKVIGITNKGFAKILQK
ncbi:MAG: ribosomal L7Ae/L30e/S12e/Gadd45 family protein [Anaeroplasmataceae bacterium]